MEFWKAFNELTVGISYGSFAVLYIIVFVRAVPSILRACKEVINSNK